MQSLSAQCLFWFGRMGAKSNAPGGPGSEMQEHAGAPRDIGRMTQTQKKVTVAAVGSLAVSPEDLHD